MVVILSLINRIGGELGISGAGIELFTSNLEYLKTEGVEASYSFAFNIGDYGNLQFSGNVNRFLTADQLSSPVSTVRDCNGFYGTRCVPQHEMRATNRATWLYDDLSVSLLWRYYSDIERETAQQASSFEQFNRIGSYSYFDLFANYRFHENVSLSFGIDNMLDKAPPVVGNSASTTSVNTGNTFPGLYDVIGRSFRTTINISF
jgi:outer membrane receptor protein involved in Fe transport